MDLIEYPTSSRLMTEAADLIADQIRSELDRTGRATLAVPGGTTPGPLFDHLCKASLVWSKVGVMLTDERWVPETSERSNTRLIKERLLTGGATAATMIPLFAEGATPEERLADLEAGLAEHLPLSVALLGMGADMHTASIFPGADRLDDALHGAGTLIPMRAPGAPEPRVTLSAAVLKKARHRHIVIIGEDKKAALARAQTLQPNEAPVVAILDDTTVHWAEG